VAALLATLLLAHAGGGQVSETGQLAYTIMLIAVLAVVWVIVGIVCWIFWRAKKRDDAEKARKELEWRNVPSS
jgi:heme/copper-type cytochrome/quinol oxidase subunit 2